MRVLCGLKRLVMQGKRRPIRTERRAVEKTTRVLATQSFKRRAT